MQRRAGSPGAVARAGPPAPEAPGRQSRRRRRAARPGILAAVAPSRGAQARRDLHGGAARRIVPNVDRPGALLRHAVRGQHQVVKTSSSGRGGVATRHRSVLGGAAPRRLTPTRVHADTEQGEEWFWCGSSGDRIALVRQQWGSDSHGVVRISVTCRYTRLFLRLCLFFFSLSLFDIRNKEICEISGHQQKKNIPV
jgi:hypothetical protein